VCKAGTSYADDWFLAIRIADGLVNRLAEDPDEGSTQRRGGSQTGPFLGEDDGEQLAPSDDWSGESTFRGSKLWIKDEEDSAGHNAVCRAGGDLCRGPKSTSKQTINEAGW
jgi:hypothetical protein